MTEPLDVKIEVFTKDDKGEDADFMYCAIVMGWNGKEWYNTKVVIRDSSPTQAFNRALAQAAKHGWWE